MKKPPLKPPSLDQACPICNQPPGQPCVFTAQENDIMTGTRRPKPHDERHI
jgi:hypothetical protein